MSKQKIALSAEHEMQLHTEKQSIIKQQIPYQQHYKIHGVFY